MGILHADLLRGNEIFSFEYDSNWLKSGHTQLLDPDLKLYAGVQYLNDQEKTNFGLFLDSSPDRWGRVLMLRKEAALARAENRNKKTLFETDYLLGVYDEHRMGALRFKLDPNQPFLSDDKILASPPWTSIRELEQISLKLEDDDIIDHPEYIKWLNMLVAPGSSLGGARPKASVLDQDNHLWIAKFPSQKDDMDIGGWEIVTYELALAAGITMAQSQAIKFSSKHHTFLTKRFDRTTRGRRLHFASAMTLLGHTDGADYKANVSYLELVEFIMTRGSNVNQDLEQLWRRIVFSICVSNVDDHLRNHGFMLSEKGWLLSPAYDINPVESGNGLKLNISDTDNALDLKLALEVYPFFRISKDQALAIIKEVKEAVKNWRQIATKYGISKTEQELKSMAFKQADEN
ncbi:HipA domain-containing protein [Fulvivirga lutea]|uniref:HipA domain-containing protein n=2 Tax=Fulvivirga lutea TaxID=2810512 RepID=A0A975A2D6_9BACT|nr:HipA domain-containing protein [Fulvivirga lutea]